MRFLEALCAYMEGVADGIRIWCDVVSGALLVFWVLTLVFVKDSTPEQLGCILGWCILMGVVGLLCPPEKTWFHWRIMLERKNETDRS